MSIASFRMSPNMRRWTREQVFSQLHPDEKNYEAAKDSPYDKALAGEEVLTMDDDELMDLANSLVSGFRASFDRRVGSVAQAASGAAKYSDRQVALTLKQQILDDGRAWFKEMPAQPTKPTPLVRRFLLALVLLQVIWIAWQTVVDVFMGVSDVEFPRFVINLLLGGLVAYLSKRCGLREGMVLGLSYVTFAVLLLCVMLFTGEFDVSAGEYPFGRWYLGALAMYTGWAIPVALRVMHAAWHKGS